MWTPAESPPHLRARTLPSQVQAADTHQWVLLKKCTKAEKMLEKVGVPWKS